MHKLISKYNTKFIRHIKIAENADNIEVTHA